MLSIGEFSRVCRLTVKALRHYHELGILVPELVDEETSYRYYGRESLERARMIQGLKEMGFSLSEIGGLLAEVKEDSDLVAHLEGKLAEVEGSIREYKRMKEKIMVSLRNAETGALGISYTVTEEMIPDTRVFGLRFTGAYSDIGRVIGELYRAAGRFATGRPFTLYYDEDYKEIGADIEVCFEARRQAEIDGVSCRLLPGGRALSLVHQGPFASIGASYRKLLECAREKSIALASPSREMYLKGPGMIFHGDPKGYRTKLVFLKA